LIVPSDNDKVLCALTDHTREETKG
jgi:hypothetical protein